MKACCVAAAFAAFAIVSLQTTLSSACTTGRCVEPATTAAKQPLQLIDQSASPRASQQKRKQSRAVEPVSGEPDIPAPSTEAAVDPGAPLPVRTVRTTRVRGSEEDVASLVMSGGASDNLRMEALPSLLASTIVNYLGGPAQIEDAQDIRVTSEVQAEAREAYAAEPTGQKPPEIALEYILMTFGGALAAASAIRLFLV
jgi:hypothetical protein